MIKLLHSTDPNTSSRHLHKDNKGLTTILHSVFTPGKWLTKQLLLPALLILAAISPATAQSISTDRIWDVDLDVTQTYSYAAKFISDGTYESDGKVYSHISMTSLLRYIDYYSTEFLEISDHDTTVGFNLREDNGVVYMLKPEGWWFPLPDSLKNYKEFPLFDFNARPGDSYMSLGTNGFMAVEGSEGYKSLRPLEVHVDSVDNVVVDGRTVRRQFIDRITNLLNGNSKSFTDEKIQVIETIGIINSGYPMAFVDEVTGAYWFSYINLSECRNLEGDVLYKDESIVIPQPPIHPVGNNIVEFHASLPDSTHLLWTAEGDTTGDGTVEMKFRNLRKWTQDGAANVAKRASSAQEQVIGTLINSGRKTTLRITGDDGTTTEYPLYDFTKGRTEKFHSVMAEISYDGDMPVLKSFTPIICKIKSAEYYRWDLSFDDRNYALRQNISEVYIPSTGKTIKGNDSNPILFSVVEGVGNIDYPLVYIADGDNLKMNEVYDNEGRHMLLGENINAPDTNHKPVNLIREGREWEYVSYHPFDTYTIYRRMKFDGTEEFYGRTYHRFLTVKTTVVNNNFKRDDDGNLINEYTVDIDDTWVNPVYLREEDSKIYMLIFDEDRQEMFDNYTITWDASQADKNPKEVMLYDFTQRAGDMAKGCAEGAFACGFPIVDTETCTVEGEECLVQTNPYNYNSSTLYESLGKYPVYDLFPYKIVEGIGFDGWGTMTFIPIFVTTNGEPHFYLSNVYNASGEVIYYGVNDTAPTKDYNGIEDISAGGADVKITDSGIIATGMNTVNVYTLDGRHVASANPGGTDFFLSTQGWAKGTYIVKATSTKATRTIKFQVR